MNLCVGYEAKLCIEYVAKFCMYTEPQDGKYSHVSFVPTATPE